MLGSVAGLAVGLAVGMPLGRWATARQEAPVTTAGVFQDVLTAIRRSFVDSLSDDDLYVKAAKGVVNTLGDPYSSFMSPEELRRYRELLTGSGRALGLRFEDGLTGVRVGAVVPGSPAHRAGILPGQYLLEIRGQTTRGLSAERVRNLLGADSAAVRLTLRTPGDSLATEVDLEPGPVHTPAVGPALRLADGIGYVALRSLADQSARQLRATLSRLEADRLQGLILDLRGNPGGRLDEGLGVAELFLDPGRRIGAVTKRHEFPAIYAARTPQPYPQLPLVILVDRRTASSAEIVAAALMDHRRAVLVGEQTFGKGLIQTTIPLGDSVAVRLSTGRWQRPNGSGLTHGLVPDSLVGPLPGLRAPSLLAAHGDLVAAELEGLARALAERSEGQERGVSEVDLLRLEARLRAGGVPIDSGSLVRHREAVELELSRLMAFLAGDGVAAERAAVSADPVVRAARAFLPPRSVPPPADSGSR